MPLTICPDCNTQVSDRAPACPKCGHPFAAQTVQATGKKWKALQLVGGLVLGFGLLTTCTFLMVGSAGGGELTGPAWTAAAGLVLYLSGRLGGWWFHG